MVTSDASHGPFHRPACALWGRSSQGHSIQVRCDNAAVVRSGTSKDKLAM